MAGDPSCLILGDNIFHGHGLASQLRSAARRTEGATVFGYWAKDPERYGVTEMDADGRVLGIEEKPRKPKSNYAVTGVYFYDDRVVELAKELEPSPRGELEITDLNNRYLRNSKLYPEKLGRGTAWLNTGTDESLTQAATYIETIEQRQGLKICCPEEIAFEEGWIDAGQLRALALPLAKNSYGEYLLNLLHRGLVE